MHVPQIDRIAGLVSSDEHIGVFITIQVHSGGERKAESFDLGADGLGRNNLGWFLQNPIHRTHKDVDGASVIRSVVWSANDEVFDTLKMVKVMFQINQGYTFEWSVFWLIL